MAAILLERREQRLAMGALTIHRFSAPGHSYPPLARAQSRAIAPRIVLRDD
jgi:hypothetical protein